MQVKKINKPSELEQAFAIRQKVFVEEQQVNAEEEYDEFEDSSVHFLALKEDVACGTARWRFTEKGVKLERFAVLSAYRSAGVGSALVAAVLDDVARHPQAEGKTRYLHAQLNALPLYEKFGFQKEGDQFEECGIKHYKMIKK